MNCKNGNHSCNSCGEKKCGNKHTTCHNADVVEVIFCENCKYCKKDTYWKELYCSKMSDDEHTHWVKKDFYCGYAERKQNDER